MKAIVFSGPSLPPELVTSSGFMWRPPVRLGDFGAAARERPDAIAVVDGYFETTPTVWHNEILVALRSGIRVYGAASIGALRAVELAPFGMIGVGRIFLAFRDGVLQDDDEVALLHGPPELGFPQLTDAMVDIRATVEVGTAAGLLLPEHARVLLAAAKDLFYKDRTYEAALNQAGRLSEPTFFRLFEDALPAIRIDQKRRDALAMLAQMQHDLRLTGPVLE